MGSIELIEFVEVIKLGGPRTTDAGTTDNEKFDWFNRQPTMEAVAEIFARDLSVKPDTTSCGQQIHQQKGHLRRWKNN